MKMSSNERNRVQTEMQKKKDELNAINEEYNRVNYFQIM